MPYVDHPIKRLEIAHLADAARLLEEGIKMVREAVGLRIRLANAYSRLKEAEEGKATSDEGA